MREDRPEKTEAEGTELYAVPVDAVDGLGRNADL